VDNVVIQVILCRITLEPRVNQLGETKVALADSFMKMQLFCHNWKVKNLQQCA
jgi:hypothetical protein